MNVFAIILLGIIVFLLGLLLLWLVFDIDVFEIVFGRKYNATGKIEFRQFLVLYPVAKHKWILYDYVVEYFDEQSLKSFTLYFGLFDTFRYIRWKGKRKNNEVKTKQINEMKHVLSLMQQDIQKYCEDNHIKKL